MSTDLKETNNSTREIDDTELKETNNSTLEFDDGFSSQKNVQKKPLKSNFEEKRRIEKIKKYGGKSDPRVSYEDFLIQVTVCR